MKSKSISTMEVLKACYIGQFNNISSLSVLVETTGSSPKIALKSVNI